MISKLRIMWKQTKPSPGKGAASPGASPGRSPRLPQPALPMRGDVLSAAGPSKLKYEKREYVIAASDGGWYEAQVVKVNLSRPETPYFVHYNGWDEKWDGWLSPDQLMKLPPVAILKGKLTQIEPSVDISSLNEQGIIEGNSFHLLSTRTGACIDNPTCAQSLCR